MNKSQRLNILLVLAAIIAGYGLGKSPSTTSKPAAEATVARVEPTTMNQANQLVTISMTATMPTGSLTLPCGVPANWISYRVQPIDQVEQLAAATGITVDELRCANGLPTWNLSAGQIIYLPIEPATAAPLAQATTGQNNQGAETPSGAANPSADATQTGTGDGQLSIAVTKPTLAAPPATPTLLTQETLEAVTISGTPVALPTPTRAWIPQEPTANVNQQPASIQSVNEPVLPAPAPTEVTPNEPPLPAPVPMLVTPVDPFALPQAPTGNQSKLVDPVETAQPAPVEQIPIKIQQPSGAASSAPTQPAKQDAIPTKAGKKAQQP